MLRHYSDWLQIFLIQAVLHAVIADSNEYRLVRDLLRSYDKRIRPSLNASLPSNVTFGYSLSQIIDVDEKNQILTTNCWLNQMWIDYGLRWKPEKYDGIKVVRLPHDAVWKPDILLYNNADVSTHYSSISSNVIVTADGNITWLSMVIFKSACAINVRYFPFDEQNCSMQFASWTYDGFQVNLVLTTSEADMSNYIPNSEWDLLRLFVERNVVYYSCCEEPYPDITFYIHIRRRPLFYIFNMVLPCVLITLVALLGFYIPSDSGEKVTMGITTLLSMTVFMMLVAENMPPNSDDLPLIGIYYGITIFIVSTATGMTVLTLNIHHKGNTGRRVPLLVKTICFGFFSRLFCMKLHKSIHWHQGSSLYVSPDEGSNNNTYMQFRLSDSEPELTVQQQHHHRSTTGSIQFDCKSVNNVHQKNTLGHKRLQPDKNNTANGFLPNMSQASHSTNHDGQSQPHDSFEQQFLRVLNKVNSTIEKNEQRLAEQEYRDSIKLEWQHVAQVVDRILLSIFVLITLTATGFVMFQAPA